MKEHKMSRRSFLKVGAVASAAGLMTAAPVAANAAAPAASTAADEENCFGLFQKKPKYIFLFIGDGMGTAQIQSARFYQGTVTNNGAITEAELSFTQFPEVGSVTTYDSTSFCPDSASTATSIASGKKTESGVINMCPWTRDVPYETIAEKLHKQKGYKVGIVSTVNIDHATPAAFYAHQKTRKNYYQIGVELANSGFEYFAGGEFQKVNGDGTGPNNHEVAAQAGYGCTGWLQRCHHPGRCCCPEGRGRQDSDHCREPGRRQVHELRHGCRSGRVAADRLCPQGH